jgi:SM-20-related protein
VAVAAEAGIGGNLGFLDLEALSRAPLSEDPFPHVIVPGFLAESGSARLARAFPTIDKPGSFPVDELSVGPVFRDFLAELQGPEFRAAIERKFRIDLTGRPTMVTLRGHARPRDGRIHNDSRSKLITVLLYMNEAWETDGGRLRLLRSPTDLNEMVAEVPPQAGTLLAFRVTDRSWHGHAPVSGPRRVIQLNWVENDGIVRRERARHGFSALVKRLLSFSRATPGR